MRRYDVVMIRDFLDHLLLEVRSSLLETYEPWPPKPGDQLQEQLERYMKEYGTCLLPVTVVEQGLEQDPAVEAARIRDRRELDELIGYLERLRPLFQLALRCAQNPEGLIRKVTLSRLADESVSFVER